jgi:hypothetical protein
MIRVQLNFPFQGGRYMPPEYCGSRCIELNPFEFKDQSNNILRPHFRNMYNSDGKKKFTCHKRPNINVQFELGIAELEEVQKAEYNMVSQIKLNSSILTFRLVLFEEDITKVRNFQLVLQSIEYISINAKGDHHRFGRKSHTSIFSRMFEYLLDPNQNFWMKKHFEDFIKKEKTEKEKKQFLNFFKSGKTGEQNLVSVINYLTFIDLYTLVDIYLNRIKLSRQLIREKNCY